MWCLADSLCKYVWDFIIYEGASKNIVELTNGKKMEGV